jgi:hypothetical protein
MLLAQRRHALLVICLAGVQMAWFTTFLILVLPPAWGLPPLAVFAALLAILLCWVLLLEALNRLHVASPQYELAVVGLLVLSTLIFDRLLLYGGRPPADLSWLGQTVRTLFSLTPGAGQILVVIGANVFLWQRAAAFTSEEFTFFGTGMSFRLGLLLLLLGAVLLHLLGRADTTPLVWVYFAFGLSAVALARIEDKAGGAQSAGAALPGPRLAQLWLTVGVVVGVAALLARFFNRAGIISFIIWLGPLWRVLGTVLNLLLIVLWWLILPLLLGLEALLRWLAQMRLVEGMAALADALAGQRQLINTNAQTASFHFPAWITTGLRYTGVALVLLFLVGVVLLFLDRIQAGRARREVEAAGAEPLTLGDGILASALERLRDLAGLARRYGVSSQLLAAISIQSIYANLARLARRRGYPRRPAQPPDDYLPVLCRAFSGQDLALARITAAYMSVHYGDRTIALDELVALRNDYHRIRRSGRQKDEGSGHHAAPRTGA